jgi:hypothetical protein
MLKRLVNLAEMLRSWINATGECYSYSLSRVQLSILLNVLQTVSGIVFSGLEGFQSRPCNKRHLSAIYCMLALV